jgi:predicted P-loop ATPase
MMAEMGLINLDEFDKYPESKMPMLKNLMQMATLHIRKAYQSNFRDLPRIASFIGTANKFDLLTDPTGSRRFICVEVTHTIDCSDICHKQIFAQLKAELAAGARGWLDKDEERTLQRHNAQFYRVLPAEELFHSYFRAAEEGEESLNMTATAIYKELQRHNSAALRGYNPACFGQVLTRAGIKRKHTKFGNIYQVVHR